jgi:hypothetical protein
MLTFSGSVFAIRYRATQRQPRAFFRLGALQRDLCCCHALRPLAPCCSTQASVYAIILRYAGEFGGQATSDFGVLLTFIPGLLFDSNPRGRFFPFSQSALGHFQRPSPVDRAEISCSGILRGIAQVSTSPQVRFGSRPWVLYLASC